MLWKHQQDAIVFARGRWHVIFHVGMGAGKTRIALEVIREEIASRASRFLCLVACPKAVMPAWAKQAGMWLPEVRILVLDKGTAKFKGAAIAAAMADTTPLIVVGNYDSLYRIKETERIDWSMVVWDEAHRLKSPSGAQSKWAARVVKRLPDCKRVALTGTLMAHSPLDVFGVYRAVESPECPTFGANWTLFKAMFAVTNPRIPGMVIGYRNQKEFARRIAETTFFRRSEDVLDLPPILHVEVPVEMTPREGSLYRQLEKEFAAEAAEGRITPANAMVGLLRMLQVCGGYAKYDDETSARQIDDQPSKRAAITELLEDIGNVPVVVFARFRGDLDSVLSACKSIGKSVSELSGRINELADWQAGKTDVLVAQIQSGGIGIDLTRASHAIFYSLGHSLAEWLQAIARLHRPGQTQHTKFFSLVSTLQGKTTADGRVYEALTSRREVVDAILSHYRASQPTGISAGGDR